MCVRIRRQAISKARLLFEFLAFTDSLIRWMAGVYFDPLCGAPQRLHLSLDMADRSGFGFPSFDFR
jgi:hypothetical protein